MPRKSASFRNPPGSLSTIMNPRRRIEKGSELPHPTETLAVSAYAAEGDLDVIPTEVVDR